MLPKVVWEMPALGTFNLHASLLPNYRGAAPINWAIINGETKTGVTTFFIDDKIDTGAMILSEAIMIDKEETAGHLHDRLMALGSQSVVKTLKLIETGNVVTQIQKDSDDIKTAYKLNKENCKIDWSKTGAEIHNLIRGLSPYPSAWCYIKDGNEEWAVKIYEVQFLTEEHDLTIGKLIVSKKELKIAVANGYLKIDSIQFPGKKKMATSELLNGLSFSENAYVY
jgi:methionyl-tRNA formyltransferase